MSILKVGIRLKFNGFCCWYAIGGFKTNPLNNPMRNAWLIGVYTIETENRIEDLGYIVSHVFATPSVIDSSLKAPDLIVFSDDGLNGLPEMETLRYVFPTSLIISVAANHIFWEDCLTYAERRSSEQSVARLLYQIHEREHRWDN